MPESKNHNYDADESHHMSNRQFYGMVSALVASLLILTYFLMSEQEREEQAIADIKTEQVAEGSYYTAVVTSVDISNGTVTLDNGDIIPADALKMSPSVNDVLSYMKTFGYKINYWGDGMPERTEQDAFLNVESIGHVSK